jgi:putative FmdB family regulatory protein
MPYHEYKCKECEHLFEEFYTTFSEVDEHEKDVQCPKCDSKNKERLITATSFQLKGGNWAKDRYGK